VTLRGTEIARGNEYFFPLAEHHVTRGPESPPELRKRGSLEGEGKTRHILGKVIQTSRLGQDPQGLVRTRKTATEGIKATKRRPTPAAIDLEGEIPPR